MYEAAVINVVLFDLGGVVIDVNKDRARQLWSERTGRGHADFDRTWFDSGIKDKMDLGTLTASQALSQVAKLSGVDPDTASACFNGMLSVRLPVVEMACRLAKTVRCGVISNTDPLHGPWIQKNSGLLRVMGAWTFSYTHHALKPDRPLYDAALADMRAVAAGTLLIDDRLDNLATARSMGMHTVQFTGLNAVRADLLRLGLQV